MTLLEEPKNNPGYDHKRYQLLHFAAISFVVDRSCQLISFLTNGHTFFVQDHLLFLDKTYSVIAFSSWSSLALSFVFNF